MMDYRVATKAYTEIAALHRRMAELYAQVGYLGCARICADSADTAEQSARHFKTMDGTTVDPRMTSKGYEAAALYAEEAWNK